MFKLIVAGGRDFDDYLLLSTKLNKLIRNKIDHTKPNLDIQIVSGTAKGADTLGERYAKENRFSLKKFPADWSKYGKGAGYIRNKEMRDYSDACVVFWDGESRGSKLMIELAREVNMPLRIVKY